jgi:Zn-dependent metalloprotease
LVPKQHHNKLRWLLLCVALLALIGGVTVARNEESGPRAAFTGLQARAAGGLDAHWNEQTGIPDYIAGSRANTVLPYTPNAIERGNPVAIARGFLDENRALFKMSSALDQLSVLRVEPDSQLGYAHVRLNQTYHSIPVFGRQLVVHLDAQENVVAVNGQFTPDIHVATQPSITSQDAERVALRDLLEEQLTGEERARVSIDVLHDRTQVMVFVDELGKATLTWNLIIMTDSPLGQWSYFVNAGRPVVVHRFDSAEHIKQRKTYTADNRAGVPGRILIDEGERAKNDAVAQAAHDGAGKVYDYYFNTFKRDAIDGRGGPMVSTVHYGSDPQDAENAAWIGERQQMIYGDGGKIFKPLAYGLDVVGHEFTHGVTDGTAGLIYQGQSGALNESYSDIFATMIDRGNWTIGEQVVKSPPFPAPVLRNLEDPSLGGKYDPRDPLAGVGQPSKMSEYARLPNSRKADNGGVHINSGIPNRVAFLVAQALGREKTEQIYYRTLTQYLTPDSNFGDAARATIRAAQELYGGNEANAVRTAFGQVGIDAAGSTGVPTQPEQPQTRTPNVPPPPAPSIPPGCTNAITNGTFENADAGWTQVSTAHSSIIDTQLPHTGARSAWLGGTDQEPVQYIYQEVRLPANATSIKLGYWRLIHYETSGLLGLFASEAKFSTNIANTNGDIVANVETFVSSSGDDEWHQAAADLSQFAGKTVRLVYGAENPKRNVSSYFIDDVELIVCTTGAAPSAPQPSSAGQVYVQGYAKNADTGRGIEGAQFFIIKPGLSASDAAADDKVTASEVLTYGVSDANGLFRTQAPVPTGKTYSVIVLARGFRAIVADDGMQVPANAGNPFSTNANLRPSR